MSLEFESENSAIADAQLDQIEASGDIKLYNAILAVCRTIFETPDFARQASTAINTKEGIRMVLAVQGQQLYKLFWSLEGPRNEAVFPYEPRWELPA